VSDRDHATIVATLLLFTTAAVAVAAAAFVMLGWGPA